MKYFYDKIEKALYMLDLEANAITKIPEILIGEEKSEPSGGGVHLPDKRKRDKGVGNKCSNCGERGHSKRTCEAGDSKPKSGLSEEMTETIKDKLGDGMTIGEIAEETGVNKLIIYKIKKELI